MLLEKIQADLKRAQLNKEEIKISTLRLLLSEIHNAQIAKGEKLTEQDLVGIIQREVKKRKEAAAGFRQGGREESALKEETEAEVLVAYLPKQLSDEDLEKIIDKVISQTGATQISEMGKVIGAVIGQVAGQAEGSRVSGLVKSKLNG